jgi:hypothetical protein
MLPPNRSKDRKIHHKDAGEHQCVTDIFRFFVVSFFDW